MPPGGSEDATSNRIDTFLQTYCLDCHNAADAAGKLNLEDFDSSVWQSGRDWDTSRWEKVVRRLRSRQMPPVDAVRPAEQQYQSVVAALETILDRAATAFPRPGRTDPIRRLNRTEYRNAIRDLLAVDVDVEALLPADEIGHGFDNVTVTDLSPVLLNRYIAAAEEIARIAVGGRRTNPDGVTVRVPADRTQESHVEGLPLGTRGGVVFEHQFPASGEYEIQLRLMRDRDEHLEGLNEPHDIDVLIDRKLVHRFHISPSKGSGYGKDDSRLDAHLKHRFFVVAGPHVVGVTFPRKSSSLLEIKRQPFDAAFNRHRHPRRSPALFEASLVGPFGTEHKDQNRTLDDTPSRRRIFTSLPHGEREASACGEEILRRLTRLAYRRPVTDRDLEVPMRFFSAGLAADGFEAGIEAALTAVLVNPHFLFRAEQDPAGVPPGAVYEISDIELASRLSFFIWSSIPDDELLRLAENGQLRDAKVLRAQVLRMLRDQRVGSLVDNFAGQWLYLRNLDSLRPDRRLFPDFDDNLRLAMRRETELLFKRVLREDRSVMDLIRSDTTFLNERLAKHYGIPGVFGSQFRPVELSGDDHHRGGLLRHASILAVTSYATRTAPTIRGNWILENILGTPPPPPPPNVPSLPEKKTTSNLTLRQRLAEHRANPACASCHDLIDPVGFALENFDAVGRWRIFDNAQPVDASGTLPDGKQITGVAELEAGIMERPELFVGTLVEKLLIFALGRGIEDYDGPAVRKIVREAADEDYRFSSLILGIVTSTPFRMRVSK